MKKFNGLKKGLVYALVTAMVASCAVGIGPLRVSAATTGQVNADALNVRSGAGTGYSRVGTVTQGETVTILETVQGDDGYTWYKISGSVSGYVRGDYITDIISDTPRRPSSSSGVITADWLNVRTGPGTNYSRMGSVAQGTRLTVISVHGEWYKITCQMDGEIKTGYVHSDYVQLDGQSGDGGSDNNGNNNNNGSDNNNNNNNNNETAIASGVVNVDVLNVRSGASTNDSVIGTIRQNESVEILAQTGSWYKVRCSINGTTQVGYVYAEYITKVSDSNSGDNNNNNNDNNNNNNNTYEKKNGVVNADVLNVRSGAGTQHSVIGQLNYNASVTIIGEENGWYKITCIINGVTKEGYVSADYITIVNDSQNNGDDNPATPSDPNDVVGKTGITTADGLNFRTGPGTEHSIIGMVHLGTQVNILGVEGDWYKVSCVMNGILKTGYMSSEYVKIVGSNDEPYDGELDADFEEQISAFPESYKNSLRRLHEQHPEWKFQAQYTGIDFEYAVDQENSGNRSLVLVTETTPFSWLSTAPGDYDWATDTYISKDGDSWKGASRELIAYYMDPRNFLDDQQIFMFETQAYDGTQKRDGVVDILDGTFMEDGNSYYHEGVSYTYVDTFMEAGQISGASPYFLASRSRQEVGGGSAAVDGSAGVSNFYNIGANASASGNAVTNGINYASQTGSWRRPWTTPWLAIVGGAEFIAESYINAGQNTPYFQKFNVVNSPYFDHQYMGNIQAPCAEATNSYSTYKEIGILDSDITFIIPVYDNMPETAAAIPPATGNPNSYVKDITIRGISSLNQTFTYNQLNYTAVASDSTITISATPVSQYATIISGEGTYTLNPGKNVITVVCQAGNGNKTTYTFTIHR